MYDVVNQRNLWIYIYIYTIKLFTSITIDIKYINELLD